MATRQCQFRAWTGNSCNGLEREMSLRDPCPSAQVPKCITSTRYVALCRGAITRPCAGLMAKRVHVILYRQGRSVMSFLKRKDYGAEACMNSSRSRRPTQNSAYLRAPNSQIDYCERIDKTSRISQFSSCLRSQHLIPFEVEQCISYFHHYVYTQRGALRAVLVR